MRCISSGDPPLIASALCPGGTNVAHIGLAGSASSELVRPAINPTTENVSVSTDVVIVVTVPDGISKPYMGNIGAIWVNSGSDKRRVTTREEMQRHVSSRAARAR